MLFYLLPQRMPPNASWCFIFSHSVIPEYGPPPSRKHSRFSLFSANLGAGWHMFLPLAIALHTLDHKRGGNNENRVLLQVSKPNRCERSFQICKVDLKFGVDISSPIPHLNTKDVTKKLKYPHKNGIPMPSARLTGWKCSLRTCPETSRDMLSFPKKSIIITNIQKQHLI